MLNLSDRKKKLVAKNQAPELDSFAAKLNSPFYKFFDYLSQYLILNVSMVLVSLLSLHLLDYFSFNACSKLFLLDKLEQESVSWGKYYFKELKNNLTDKKMHSENIVHILCLASTIICFETSFLLEDVSNTTRFITSIIGISSFIFFLSQRFWAGPLRNYYQQESSCRNFLLYIVFFLQKILFSLVLLVLQLALIYLLTVLPAIFFLIYAPIIPLVACYFVKDFHNKRNK